MYNMCDDMIEKLKYIKCKNKTKMLLGSFW